jgi:serine protease inhibitor
MQPTSVALALPKFQIAGATISLKAELEALGMKAAFGAGADFSAMTSDPVVIDDVVHQAYIGVDEHGTEAAAATGVIFGDAGVVFEASAPVPMAVDRPFFIAIRDVPTNTILFAGKVVDPAN